MCMFYYTEQYLGKVTKPQHQRKNLDRLKDKVTPCFIFEYIIDLILLSNRMWNDCSGLKTRKYLSQIQQF